VPSYPAHTCFKKFTFVLRKNKTFCFAEKNNSMEDFFFSLWIIKSYKECNLYLVYKWIKSNGLKEFESFSAVNGYYICFSAWAMVDGGSNVKARSSYNEKTPRIVVSRSHSGMVKQVAFQTFGNQTTIIPAGGAGMFFLLRDSWYCSQHR
jgi:hypothetical protein